MFIRSSTGFVFPVLVASADPSSRSISEETFPSAPDPDAIDVGMDATAAKSPFWNASNRASAVLI